MYNFIKKYTNKQKVYRTVHMKKHYNLISLSEIRENLERSKGKCLPVQKSFHKIISGFLSKKSQTKRDIIFRVLKEKNS